LEIFGDFIHPTPPPLTPLPNTPHNNRQSAPGLIIIVGAFTVAGLGVQGIHWAANGGKKRPIRRDNWTWNIEKRDEAREAKAKQANNS
jgi:hypothetical protein